MNVIDFVPPALKPLPLWVLWRLEDRNGKSSKVPYTPDGKRRASSTDPTCWGTYDEALKTLSADPDRFNGLGLIISKKYRMIFCDCDHCLSEDGEIDQRGIDFLETFVDEGQTYVEVSQSGTGLHALAMGEIERSFKNSTDNVEMYNDSRFCACTFKALSAVDPVECPEALTYFFNRYKTKKTAENKHSRPDVELKHSDKWVIESASRRNGLFPALFKGDLQAAGIPNHSEADFSLLLILAFWTNADPVAMDRLFRASGLYRAKWERATYRETSIRKAIDELDETLHEFQQRRIREEGDKWLKQMNSVT